ncbi:glycoside hydrolase family 1 protein [Marisediminicola senii]|uniref:glycoside hydrolase family 1 protein n=1 Tax=Marisediminicola senii TaxID=2711233 RepID=UPI0022A67736|nr:family 1 glycosylhydrolase [Marisediminicola senii]
MIPAQCVVGVTSSAIQVEGAFRDDGRLESTWDTFMAQPGRIADGSNAAIAADQYHRSAGDVQLLRELGVDSYRLSLGWPRLQPGGRGGANRAAIAYYDRLLDDLLRAGIHTAVALHHWDVPEPLQHIGGWLNRDTASRLADFAYLAGEAFGDRVDAWTTLTEPATVTTSGYGSGRHAPGATLGSMLGGSVNSGPGLVSVAHHQLLGHGLAVEALRAADVRGTIGIDNVHTVVEPASDRMDDALRASLHRIVQHALYADPVLLGRYPSPSDEQRDAAPQLFDYLERVDPRDLAVMSAPIDRYGVVYRGPVRLVAGGAAGIGAGVGAGAGRVVGAGIGAGVGRVVELDADPDALVATLRELGAHYGEALPPVVVTTGASYPDVARVPGDDTSPPNDAHRIGYLGDHLAALSDMASGAGVAGVTIAGFDIDSFLDGWDWTAGFTQPTGLVAVDRNTRDRTPKRSYRWLQQLLGGR